MKADITAVVDGFKRLTGRDKTLAYIEIEEIWKALPKVKLKQVKPVPQRS
jgi:hypothetical protein